MSIIYDPVTKTYVFSEDERFGLDILSDNNTESRNALGNAFDNGISGNDWTNILDGAAGDDYLNGRGGNDSLIGGQGADRLDGGLGADTLVGGEGDDSYYVDDAGDVIVELAGGGSNSVYSSVSYTLGANLERLVLQGFGNINGTGNDANNALEGNAGHNILDGGGGDDALLSSGASDTLIGGLGNDRYFVYNIDDVIVEGVDEGFEVVRTFVSYTLAANVENLELVTVDTNGTGNDGNNSIVAYQGKNILSGEGGNDTLEAGSGDDTLYGGDGNDSLYGGVGADVIYGGKGNDRYFLDDAGDLLFEEEDGGIDLVEIRFNFASSYVLGEHFENLGLDYWNEEDTNGTGNGLNNIIYGSQGRNVLDGLDGNDNLSGLGGNDTLLGGEGDDSLNGGEGIDSLTGGLGDDLYFIDSADDIIVENADEGNDTVWSFIDFALTDVLENLTLSGNANLTGTGNDKNNMLVGNNGSNTLSGGQGQDTLDGGLGADRLEGGADDDTYIVDDAGDTILENDAGGNDTVFSKVSHALAANIETLQATGSAAIHLTGNDLANLISGNDAANTLTGGAGADTLQGGAGNDVYYLERSGEDQVVDVSGIDTIISSFSYLLAPNLENLTGSGSASIALTGNALNNTITGNTGTNTIKGGLGNDKINGLTGKDTLYGGAGKDIFQFTTKASSSNIDKIADYSVTYDTIQLDNKYFTKLGSGSATSPKKLASSAFYKGARAHDGNDRFIYDATKGYLYYDADGTGSSKQVLIATFSNKAALKYSEFYVI